MVIIPKDHYLSDHEDLWSLEMKEDPHTSIHFVIPGSLDANTGGTRYDRRMIEGLSSLGHEVQVQALPGSYPQPSEYDKRKARSILGAIPKGSLLIVDGLVLGAIPDIARSMARTRSIIALVHHPLCDETGLADDERNRLLRSETGSLKRVDMVLVTSDFTARRMKKLGLLDEGTPIRVVEPGVDPAPIGPGHSPGTPFSLISVGALTERKGYGDLLRALDGLRDLDWTWTCIGREDQEERSSNEVKGLLHELDLQHRVLFTGEVSDRELEERFLEAHLLVHPSRYEGYGMVIPEAISRGIPVISSSGGALADTLPEGAGLIFEPGDISRLRKCLREVMEDDDLYRRIRSGAIVAREELRIWDDAASEFGEILGGMLP